MGAALSKALGAVRGRVTCSTAGGVCIQEWAVWHWWCSCMIGMAGWEQGLLWACSLVRRQRTNRPLHLRPRPLKQQQCQQQCQQRQHTEHQEH